MSNLPSNYDPHENSYAPYSLIIEHFGDVKIGGSCNFNDDCFDENCLGGICMPLCNKVQKSSGCDCIHHKQCKSNNCIDKKCSSTDCNGENKAATCSCLSNSDCVNNNCDNNKCAILLPLNSNCFKDIECSSNKCRKDKSSNSDNKVCVK